MPRLSVDQAHEAFAKCRYGPAFRAMKAWAELGEASAFHMLAYMYDNGLGTRRSQARAVHWYTRAYESGESMAASNLAVIYRDSGDAKLEFAWYQRAMELGDGDAHVEIGIRYLAGKGVRRNLQKAASSFRSALRSKHITEAGVDTARQLLWGMPKSARGA